MDAVVNGSSLELSWVAGADCGMIGLR
jgi:hypothetical protein